MSHRARMLAHPSQVRLGLLLFEDQSCPSAKSTGQGSELVCRQLSAPRNWPAARIRSSEAAATALTSSMSLLQFHYGAAAETGFIPAVEQVSNSVGVCEATFVHQFATNRDSAPRADLAAQTWHRQRVRQADLGAGRAFLLAAVFGMCGIIAVGWSQNPPTPPAAREKKAISQAQVERFGPLQRTLYVAALRGSEWLSRQQRPDGTFPVGLEPALGCPPDQDNYLRQIQAALALAQAARLTGQERWAARARQAVLVSLAGTTPDPQDGQSRFPRPPLVTTGRLSAAGLLVAAIHQLPEPGEDVLNSAEQLARWIARQQQADGTLRLSEPTPGLAFAPGIDEEMLPLHFGPGQALWGVTFSHSLRPQAWKLDLVRRARQPYYRLCQEHLAKLGIPLGPAPVRSTDPGEARPGAPCLIVWHIAAWAEAYCHTQERPFAEFVFELADALLTLQYTEAAMPQFLGGFAESVPAKLRRQPPDWHTGWYAWALVYAAWTARLAKDHNRYQRYTLAAENALQFLTTLQYTSLNTGHFTLEYQPQVLGGFRRGLRESVISLDAQQAAVSALWTYLELIVCMR